MLDSDSTLSSLHIEFRHFVVRHFWFRQKNRSTKYFREQLFSEDSKWVQSCQMVYFQTQNSNLGKFWRSLQRKMLVYFTAIWYILRTFGIFYGHLVYFTDIWYIIWPFGIPICWLIGTFFPFWYVVPWKIWQPWAGPKVFFPKHFSQH
jgi:hypothetical protein